MKFRKKPVVIEAEQWFPGANLPDVEEVTRDTGTFGSIKTLEGEMLANPGDWVITGVKGEKYPCKPDIFEATYEKVEEPS